MCRCFKNTFALWFLCCLLLYDNEILLSSNYFIYPPFSNKKKMLAIFFFKDRVHVIIKPASGSCLLWFLFVFNVCFAECFSKGCNGSAIFSSMKITYLWNSDHVTKNRNRFINTRIKVFLEVWKHQFDWQCYFVVATFLNKNMKFFKKVKNLMFFGWLKCQDFHWFWTFGGYQRAESYTREHWSQPS